jgi:hypothetical protein
LVQVDVDRLGARVEQTQVLLQFANAEDGGLEDALDVLALLRVDDLVVAVFKFLEDVDVLYVQLSQVGEDLIILPLLDVWSVGAFDLFGWDVLHFDLLLQVVHGITQHQVI